jgi:hypothetical protein
MAFTLQSFAQLRPYVYHLTARENLEVIQGEGELVSAGELFRLSQRRDLLRVRRDSHVNLRVNGQPRAVRDQSPLHAGNVSLEGSWSFDDLVEHINRHVFFWPGRAEGPIDYGRRHFERYKHEDCVVLVIPTSALFTANADRVPRFCPYNSGSPRCSGGKRSPRGEGTFVPAEQFSRAASDVVECVFEERARIPWEHCRVRPHTDWC